MIMAYNTLNKLKWTNKLDKCEIIIKHRGAKNNIKNISGPDVTEIKKSYFCYKDNDKETFIPLHRILEIKFEGKIIWKRKNKPSF